MTIEEMKNEFHKRFEEYVHPSVMEAMLVAVESLLQQSEPEVLKRALPKEKAHRLDCFMITIGRECNCGAEDYNQCRVDCLKPKEQS